MKQKNKMFPMGEGRYRVKEVKRETRLYDSLSLTFFRF